MPLLTPLDQTSTTSGPMDKLMPSYSSHTVQTLTYRYSGMRVMTSCTIVLNSMTTSTMMPNIRWWQSFVSFSRARWIKRWGLCMSKMLSFIDALLNQASKIASCPRLWVSGSQFHHMIVWRGCWWWVSFYEETFLNGGTISWYYTWIWMWQQWQQ